MENFGKGPLGEWKKPSKWKLSLLYAIEKTRTLKSRSGRPAINFYYTITAGVKEKSLGLNSLKDCHVLKN